jgi:hypothetical protein
MSEYDIEAAYHRLRALGVDTSELYQDYNKIPLENIDLSKVEQTLPDKKKKISKHNIVIDSRSRNYQIYPNSNKYLVELMEPHRNVERIELIAAVLPKTEYNVSSENNLILLTIGGVTEQLYLTEGQYIIGTNAIGQSYITNGDPVIFGFLFELQNVLNSHSLSGNDFNVFLATVPSTNGTGNAASVLNRIVITNSSVSFSLDLTNQYYSSGSPYRLLGLPKSIISSAANNVIYGSSDTGVCTPADLQAGTTHTISIQSIVCQFDYDLIDDPKYIIMDIEFGNKSADRIESIDISSNQKFAIVIYDANDPDNIETYPLNNTNVQAGTFRRPGRLKALKGADFDKKIIEFDPPFTLENLKITFYKYDNTLYNFHNREHVLTFEIDVAEFDPRYRY